MSLIERIYDFLCILTDKIVRLCDEDKIRNYTSKQFERSDNRDIERDIIISFQYYKMALDGYKFNLYKNERTTVFARNITYGDLESEDKINKAFDSLDKKMKNDGLWKRFVTEKKEVFIKNYNSYRTEEPLI